MVHRFILPPLRNYQTELVKDQRNEVVCLSSTQVGKTFAYACKLLAAMWEYRGPHSCWWTAPTYKQSRVAQKIMYMIAESAGIRARGPSPPFEQNPPPSLVLIQGSTCEYRTWDHPANLMGDPVAAVVVDEAGLLNSAAHGAISTRRSYTLGPAWYIGNPGPVEGPFERLCDRAEKEGRLYRWTWRTMHEWLTEHDPQRAVKYLEHIESERATLDRREFKRLYEAEWADWNELPVYTFDRARNVSAEHAEYQQPLPVDLSCDFNVAPMCWPLGQHRKDMSWAFDEIVIPGEASTQAACQVFLGKFPNKKTEVNVYGDASGRSRDTRSHTTDYEIITSMLGKYYNRFSMNVPAANPSVTNSINAFNARLLSAAGEVRYYVHPRCTTGIRDLSRVSFKPGTRDIEKKDRSLTHWSDAERCRHAVLFPLVEVAPAAVWTPRHEGDADDQIIGVQF